MEAYHVLKGVFFSPDLTDRKVYTTRNGAGVTITVQDGDTYVNDAKIIASDYLISMGVMHILDKYGFSCRFVGTTPFTIASLTEVMVDLFLRRDPEHALLNPVGKATCQLEHILG